MERYPIRSSTVTARVGTTLSGMAHGTAVSLLPTWVPSRKLVTVSTTAAWVASGAWLARETGGVHFSCVSAVFVAMVPDWLPQLQVTVSVNPSAARVMVMVISCPSSTPAAVRVDTRGILGSSSSSV